MGYTLGIAFSKGGFNNWNWGGFFTSVVIGAVTSGIASEIGGAVSAGVSSGSLSPLAGVAIQAGSYSALGGFTNFLSGGDFVSGAISGAVGSGMASLVGAFTSNAFAQIGSAALAGGLSAEFTGGDFWRGAATAGIVAGFNHVAHGSFAKKYNVNVLHDDGGAKGLGHDALAFENEDGSLRYISKDEPVGEYAPIVGESRFTDRNFGSIGEINNYYDKFVAPGKRYDVVAVYRATRSQISRGITTARQYATAPYNIITCNCGTVVEQTLISMYRYPVQSGGLAPNLNFYTNRLIFFREISKVYRIK